MALCGTSRGGDRLCPRRVGASAFRGFGDRAGRDASLRPGSLPICTRLLSGDDGRLLLIASRRTASRRLATNSLWLTGAFPTPAANRVPDLTPAPDIHRPQPPRANQPGGTLSARPESEKRFARHAKQPPAAKSRIAKQRASADHCFLRLIAPVKDLPANGKPSGSFQSGRAKRLHVPQSRSCTTANLTELPVRVKLAQGRQKHFSGKSCPRLPAIPK